MYIPSFKELKEVTDSRYTIVSLISKRARKIVDGQKPLIDTKSEKPVSIAMKEVINGSIIFGEPMSDRAYNEKIKEEKERKLAILREEKMKEAQNESDEVFDTEIEEN